MDQGNLVNQILTKLTEMDSSTLLNVAAVGALFYIVMQNQKKLRQEMKALKSDGEKRKEKSQKKTTTTGKSLVALTGSALQKVKNSFTKSQPESAGVMIDGKEYSLDFVPILRITSYLSEGRKDVVERLEKIAERAISDRVLQEQFVSLMEWCQNSGSDLTKFGSPAFTFSLKRFKLSFDRNEISSQFPETIFKEIFSEFDIKDTLAGPSYSEDSSFVATLSDSFVHQLISYKLNAHDSAVLLSLMPPKRVAIHLDLLGKKRLKSVIKPFSSMIKMLNTMKVKKVIAKVRDFFVPIAGANQKKDIKKFFEHMMDNMSDDTSYEFVVSMRKQKISQKIVPNNITVDMPLALPAGNSAAPSQTRNAQSEAPRRPAPRAPEPTPVSITEVPLTPNRPLERHNSAAQPDISVDPSMQKDEVMERAKNLFISFSESVDGDEDINIK